MSTFHWRFFPQRQQFMKNKPPGAGEWPHFSTTQKGWMLCILDMFFWCLEIIASKPMHQLLNKCACSKDLCIFKVAKYTIIPSQNTYYHTFEDQLFSNIINTMLSMFIVVFLHLKEINHNMIWQWMMHCLWI